MTDMPGAGICIHKGGSPYETRVGWCCDTCACIRWRHSDLVLMPVLNAGGISVLTSVAIPRGAFGLFPPESL